MQQRFHVYVRRYRDGRYTMSVLTHPRYTVYGDKLKVCRDELREVLARELALESLRVNEHEHWNDLEAETLDLELRAVQHERLIRVPMRFLVLHRATDDGVTEVFVPNLDLRFRVQGHEERLVWTEERIRGHFHLATVQKLVAHRFAKHERVETLLVTYHGPGRYKDALKAKQAREARIEAERSVVGGALATAGIELVEEARRGRIPRALGRDDEVRRLMAMLAERSGRSVALRGPAGVGKTALVHELAHRIATGRCPEALADLKVWHVTGNRLLAGLPFLGQWQERVLDVARELRESGGILFGDSLLELAMAGWDEEGSSAATLFEGFVRDDAIRMVVESTDDAWLLAERLAPGLCRILRRVDIAGMGADDAVRVLVTLGGRMGRKQGTVVTDDSLARAFELLARFGGADSLPGSGLALLDRMIRLAPGRTLTPADAVAAFSRTTGFPEVLVDPAQKLDEPAVRAWFAERVVGQPEATNALVDLILVIKAGLADPGRPLGSFLLAGPTGVGKTESAKALAEWLFGDAGRLVRLDMSEYAGTGAAWRLLEGPQSLTTRIRERPFGVVLLDEIEKADPSVFDVLLQVLDEGRLTDHAGRLTSFRHTIVLMTSNLGATRSRPIGPVGPEDTAKRYRAAVEGFFRPEFVNRIGRVVPYGPLSDDALRRIARVLLEEALEREGLARRGVAVRWEPGVLDVLVEQGSDARYGARPMKRALDRLVVQPLARALVAGRLGTEVHLTARDGAIHLA
ncbi:MAG: ATP-dependent Clp protease ATP-binding subunit [Alphaproteobacteria bacterium]|nr:ATP-dependent Clp protease ATP-binding subunit [Alphaproteobacteria bacterium]